MFCIKRKVTYKGSHCCEINHFIKNIFWEYFQLRQLDTEGMFCPILNNKSHRYSSHKAYNLVQSIIVCSMSAFFMLVILTIILKLH